MLPFVVKTFVLSIFSGWFYCTASIKISISKAHDFELSAILNMYLCVSGGLGDCVAGAISECRDMCLKKLAVRECPRSGKPAELMQKYGISAEHIVKAVKSMLS